MVEDVSEILLEVSWYHKRNGSDVLQSRGVRAAVHEVALEAAVGCRGRHLMLELSRRL